jgi:hypothetical protein
MTDLARGVNMPKTKNAYHFMGDIMPKHIRDFYLACAIAAVLAIAGYTKLMGAW